MATTINSESVRKPCKESRCDCIVHTIRALTKNATWIRHRSFETIGFAGVRNPA